MNISLPPELRDWVNSQVAAGCYGTASEFVRDVLRHARAPQFSAQIDSTFKAAARSGADIEMTDADWDEIRTAARAQAKKARHRSA